MHKWTILACLDESINKVNHKIKKKEQHVYVGKKLPASKLLFKLFQIVEHVCGKTSIYHTQCKSSFQQHQKWVLNLLFWLEESNTLPLHLRWEIIVMFQETDKNLVLMLWRKSGWNQVFWDLKWFFTWGKFYFHLRWWKDLGGCKCRHQSCCRNQFCSDHLHIQRNTHSVAPKEMKQQLLDIFLLWLTFWTFTCFVCEVFPSLYISFSLIQWFRSVR